MLGREEFQLVETLLYTRQQGFFLLEQHLQRLRRSAHTLGFSCPSEQLLLQRLGQEAQHWPPESASRIRLLIDRHGMICVERAAMAAVALHPPISMNAIKASKPLEVILDSAATPAFGVFTKHKTTQRDAYTAARKRVGIASDGSGPAFDVLMFNEHGELTESSIANVAIQQPDGSWVTPKVHCGLLPGVMRAELLARNHLREQCTRRVCRGRQDTPQPAKCQGWVIETNSLLMLFTSQTFHGKVVVVKMFWLR
eukprot:scaffold185458_cov26-Tisochrysis_lutea.AAC.1